MDFLFYAATVFVAFSGLIVGAVLAFVSPEEMPTGKKYFPLLQRIVLLALFTFFVNALGLPLLLRILVYALIIAYALTRTNTAVVYPLIALLLFFSSFNPNAFLTLTVLAFFYGLPSGSLYAATAGMSKYRVLATIVFKHSSFIVVALALPLLLKLLF
jgi:hypothetical protein